MARSRAENRDFSIRKALRKRRISEEVFLYTKDHPLYDNLHQFSDNKIHCSCPICSRKTKNKGKRIKKNYHPSLNYKKADAIKVDSLDFQEKDEN